VRPVRNTPKKSSTLKAGDSTGSSRSSGRRRAGREKVTRATAGAANNAGGPSGAARRAERRPGSVGRRRKSGPVVKPCEDTDSDYCNDCSSLPGLKRTPCRGMETSAPVRGLRPIRLRGRTLKMPNPLS